MDLGKKAFHHMKLVKKELKKARDFEVRKLLRRLKQLEGNTAAAAVGSECPAAAAVKLQAQLAAARGADLDRLTAAAAPFLVQQQRGGQAAAAAAAAGVEAAAEVEAAEAAGAASAQAELQPVERRICAARCVATCVAAARAALEALEQKAARAAQRQEEAQVQAQVAGQLREERAAKKRKASRAAEGGGAVSAGGGSGEEDGEQEPRQLDATASDALQKLLVARPGQGAVAAVGGAESDSEADSGLFRSGSEDAALLADSDDVEDEVQAEQQRQQLAGSARKGGQQQKAQQKQQPKKKGNRLGQRARRRLAEQQTWAAARVQRNGHGRPLPGSAGAAPPPKPAQQLKQQQRERPEKQHKANSAAGGDDVAGLHPSWAAHKKQRLSISSAAPTGHKVVFDDDGRPADGIRPVAATAGGKPSSSDKTGASLHPSWAAKQRQQQALILPPQGRKIVFDESD